MAIPFPLSLGFSTSDRTSANSGAPVVFGAVAFGGNASGGGAAPYSVDQSGSAAATTVVPQITTIPGMNTSGLPGEGIFGPTGAIPMALSLGGAAMGLNGNQAQDPRMAAIAAQGHEEGDGGPGGMFGGLPSIGLIGLAVAAVAAVIIVAR